MKIKLVPILFLLYCQVSIMGQDSTGIKITVYQPYTTINIDPEQDIKIFKNDIKWNYTMLCRGSFLINYERLITKKISLEAGVSLNYRDYLLEGDWKDNNYYFPSDKKGVKAKLGLGFEFSPRIYPKDGNLEGFYISPAIRFRSYNVSVTDPIFYGDTYKGDFNASYETTDLAFIIGSQWESYWIGGTSEYYFGVGLRQNKYYKIDEKSDLLVIDNLTEKYPCILFGLKIGITY